MQAAGAPQVCTRALSLSRPNWRMRETLPDAGVSISVAPAQRSLTMHASAGAAEEVPPASARVSSRACALSLRFPQPEIAKKTAKHTAMRTIL
eukprot:10461249-Alexandrium_andersonii.AAC.1